jgi:hypothetical protein
MTVDLWQNLITNKNNMEQYKERNRKVCSVAQVPTLLVNDKGFNKYGQCLQKLILSQLLKIAKGGAISILKDSLPGNFPSIKMILIIEAEIRV